MPSSAVVATLIADPRSLRLSDAHIARPAQGVGGLDSRQWLDEGVAADAGARIGHFDLTALLYAQGIPRTDFVEGPLSRVGEG